MLSLLVVNSLRLTNISLFDQAQVRVAELDTLFNASLAAPLAQRDYGTLRNILEDIHNKEGITYLVLLDRDGKQLAAVGTPPAELARAASATLSPDEIDQDYFNLAVPIRLAGQGYGRLAFGLSSSFLKDARTHLLRQSLIIAGIEIMLSIVLLTALGIWLTRHMAQLTQASKAIQQGDYESSVIVSSDDEVGQMASAFNSMTQAVRERITLLEESEERFHAIADFTYDLEFWLAPDGRLLWINPTASRMMGYTPEECLAMPDFPMSLVAEKDRTGVRRKLEEDLQGKAAAGYTFHLLHREGHELPVSGNWQPIYDRHRRYMGLRISLRDVSALKAAETDLRKALGELSLSEATQRCFAEEAQLERARLVSLLSAMNLGILFVGAEGNVIYHNPAFLKIWKLDEAHPVVGMPATDIVMYARSALERPEHLSRHLLSVLETGDSTESFEIAMRDGRVVTQLNYPVRDPVNRLIGHLWVYEDVTHERQTAAQLAYLAERDALTGLYNRHRFQQEIQRMLTECDSSGSQGALMFFDLDEFKIINDTFGHRAGDSLLIRVANEVNALVRRNEMLTRLGGDEFALLVPRADEENLLQLAERVVRTVASIPFSFEGKALRLTASLGIALYPSQAADSDELIAHADAAMYQAKQAGKNTWRSYRSDLDNSRFMVEHLTWNDRITNALEKGLFQLHFQGIYHARSGKLAHLEALLRMVDEQNPNQLIMPARFIHLAEKSGKILDIDRWVLAEAIRLLHDKPAMPSLAVNISGRSFDDPRLPHYIDTLLRQNGVAPNRLQVELTETSAVSDLADAQTFIEALRATGCGVCLDDFGSGFSSFAYLKHLKVGTVKIDGLFVRNLPTDQENQVFVKAIADVARGLGKLTIAEFVEDAETLAMLRDFGVDMVQGYHLDKPQRAHPGLDV
ncbi:MAG: EAL domain-containing protein, partial [Thiobacillus sp.]|nr:EAL domain-containing protein [Thiobacillus sp.]